MTTELKPTNGELFLYKDDYGTVKLNGLIYDESLWLPQAAIAELFDTTKQNIGQHIKNIFNDAELSENSVVKKFFTTASDGKNYETSYYNLDMIISVGYRVNSKRATQFRIWATKVLH
jgi:hypothetical protein